MKKLILVLSFIFLIACFGVLSFKNGEIINPKVEESIAKARPPEIQTNDSGDDIITLQYASTKSSVISVKMLAKNSFL